MLTHRVVSKPTTTYSREAMDPEKCVGGKPSFYQLFWLAILVFTRVPGFWNHRNIFPAKAINVVGGTLPDCWRTMRNLRTFYCHLADAAACSGCDASMIPVLEPMRSPWNRGFEASSGGILFVGSGEPNTVKLLGTNWVQQATNKQSNVKKQAQTDHNKRSGKKLDLPLSHDLDNAF